MKEKLSGLLCDVLLRQNITLKNGKQKTLEELLGTLPEEQHKVLCMRYIEGMSSRNIAKVLDISYASVQYALKCALRYLRRKENRSVIENCINRKTPLIIF